MIHGFLRTPAGTFTTIDAPGSTGYTQAWDINNAGHIVGVPLPVPEPGSLVLLSVGLLGLGFAWRRKALATVSAPGEE